MDPIIKGFPDEKLTFFVVLKCNNEAPAKSFYHLDVSENRDTPKSYIFIGFSIINHPFWGIPIFGNTHLVQGINFQAFWSNLPA